MIEDHTCAIAGMDTHDEIPSQILLTTITPPPRPSRLDGDSVNDEGDDEKAAINDDNNALSLQALDHPGAQQRINGHRYTSSRRRKSTMTSTSTATASSTSKVTFPSLTVSVSIQAYWARRNRRRSDLHYMMSTAGCLPRNRSFTLLISFACLLMTITTLSSIRILERHHLQFSYSQYHHAPHRYLEQQQRLYRRRQLRTSLKTTTAAALQDLSDVISNTYHYLSFGSERSDQINDDSIPYPFLLDNNVQMVTIPSSMQSTWSSYARYVDYVTACTQSLVDGGTEITRTTTTTSTATAHLSPTTTSRPDVITIEYTFTYDLTQRNYFVLIQRLRQRYPNAVIVLVQVLPSDPFQFLQLVEEVMIPNALLRHNATTDERTEPKMIMNFRQWQATQELIQQQETMSINDLIEAMYEVTKKENRESNNGQRYWILMEPSLPTTTTILANSVEFNQLLESDVQILQYRNPLWHTDFTNEEFQEKMQLFWNHFSFAAESRDTTNFFSTPTSTSIGLSLYGHMSISNGVRTLVEEYFFTNKIDDSRSPTSNDNIGDWGSGDDCHMWYTSGDYGDVELIGGRIVNVPAVTNNKGDELYKETLIGTIFDFLRRSLLPSSYLPHKHVLEFHRSTPSSYFDISSFSSSNKNYIVVNNPFKTSRLLSISYLTDADGMSYPKTLILLNEIPSVQIQPMHDLSVTNPIDVVNSNNLDQQHVAKTSSVGYIPPGKSMLQFIPLQHTILPFRLVGVSILAEELQQHSSNEYTFEMDVATTTTTVSLTDV